MPRACHYRQYRANRGSDDRRLAALTLDAWRLALALPCLALAWLGLAWLGRHRLASAGKVGREPWQTDCSARFQEQGAEDSCPFISSSRAFPTFTPAHRLAAGGWRHISLARDRWLAVAGMAGPGSTSRPDRLQLSATPLQLSGCCCGSQTRTLPSILILTWRTWLPSRRDSVPQRAARLLVALQPRPAPL